MNKTLEQLLDQNYPSVFNDLMAGSTNSEYSRMGCGDGWYHIIDVIGALLTNHSKKIKARQVKEKFGSLRFYQTNGDAYTQGIVRMAEVISGRTCEICGNPGHLYCAGGWIATRCLGHVSSEMLAGDVRNLNTKKIRGIGLGWSRLINGLQALIEVDQERDPHLKLKLSNKLVDGRLQIKLVGDHEVARGAVDFVNVYAAKIDQESGACQRYA